MSVEISIPVHLSKFADSKRVIKTIPGKLSAVFDYLKSNYPELSKKIFDEKGNLNPYFKIFLQGKEKNNVVYLGENITNDLRNPDYEIEDGQKIKLLVVVTGGQKTVQEK